MTVRSETSPPAPYVGLRPFEFREAALFYGRGEHIAEMVRILRKGHFLAVVGSSGSGKSSLVRAGLLPAIAGGFMNGDEDGSDWRFVVVRPGLDPYENLLRELLPTLALDQPLDPALVAFRSQTLRAGPRGLVEAIADSLLPEPTRLVVLIDQFEEVFRLVERGGPGQPRDDRSSAEQRNAALAFVDMLLATATERDRRVYVVLTMRSEYLGECEAFLGLSAAIARSQFLTPRMTREQIQDIIERPLAAVRGRIEPAVVTAILNSLGTAQDQLPRLEHILLRMWDRVRADREITLRDYIAVGGFESGLDQHLEQFYEELGSGVENDKSSERQRVAEQLFRSVARRTPEGTLVRRPSSVGEVASIAGASEQIVAEVVEHFRQPGCNFLVAIPAVPLTGETTLELSHESLLRQSKRLGKWVTAEADAAAELQRLVRDARSWREGKRGVLRQPELGLYRKWRKESVPSRDWAARYVESEEFDLADEYLRQSLRKSRILQGTAVAAIAVMLVLTLFSVYLWSRAETSATDARRESNHAKESATAAEASERKAKRQSAAAEASEWNAKHQSAMTHLEVAKSEIEKGNLATGIFHYWQAYDEAPNNDPLKLNARTLLASWCFHEPLPLIHDDNVRTVAFSPDGLTVVTGSDDKTARLWDANTGKPKCDPLKHDGKVLSVAFSPDGLTVVTGSDDKTARLWDANTGKPKCDPLKHDGKVLSVAFSPDKRTVVTGSDDNTARLWDAKTGQPKKGEPLKHDDEYAVVSVAFSPDSRTVVTGSDDNTARLWDVETGKPKCDPLKHEGAVMSVAFSPDGQAVLTGSDDNTARLWDAKTGKPIGQPLMYKGRVSSVASSPDGQTVPGSERQRGARGVASGAADSGTMRRAADDELRVMSVAFSPDKRTVVTGSWDNTARLWDAKTRKPIGQPLEHKGRVSSVAFSPDNRTVVTGSWDNTARLWNAKTGQPIGQPLMHERAVMSVAFSPDKRTVVTGSDDNTARLWDIKTDQARYKPLEFDDECAVVSVAFSKDSRTVVTGSDDNTARLWDAKTGQPKGEPLEHKGTVSSVALSRDGGTVVTGSDDKTARLWDAKTGKPIGDPLMHEAAVISLAFSSDGQAVLTGSRDNTTRLWDAKTGRPIGEPLQHKQRVSCMAFSPDGGTVVTGSDDKTARLWDAKTGQPIGQPLEHKGKVSCMAFSPDGGTVVTGSDDKIARLWDAKTGQPIGQPLEHKGKVSSVTFSPDGGTVLTGSWDNTARLWDAKTGKPKGEPLQHNQRVSFVAFSPKGQTVLTVSSHKTARLWDAITGQPEGQPLQHEAAVLSVAFSPDGEAVLTGSADNTARLWNVVPPAADEQPERLKLSVEVRTGFYLKDGIRTQLHLVEWLNRRAQLDDLGGFCDVCSSEPVREVKKPELSTPKNKR